MSIEGLTLDFMQYLRLLCLLLSLIYRKMRVFDSTKLMHFLVHLYLLPKNMRNDVLRLHEGCQYAQSKHETTSPSLFLSLVKPWNCLLIQNTLQKEVIIILKVPITAPHLTIMHNSENITFNNCAIRRYDTTSDAAQANSDKQMEYVSQFLQVEQISPKNEACSKNNNEIATVSAINPAHCPAQE